MAWPKGKPRLSEEQRAERAAAKERPMYDMVVPFRHGDGKLHGCGEFVTSSRLLDPESGERARAVMAEHKKNCWSEKKRG